jgi:hypothetical protein
MRPCARSTPIGVTLVVNPIMLARLLDIPWTVALA